MSNILFVSHDVDLCAVAARVLRRAGWQVSTAAHAGHALLACVEGPPFDVLVIEDRMPDAAGAAIAAWLRRDCPALAVVRMCGPAAAGAGPGVAVVRPFTADDLFDAILRSASAIATA